jgi:hypothetical protein
MHSLYIAADLQSAVINTQKLNAAMKMPDWVDELQIFHTTVKNINELRSPCKVPNIVVQT